MKALLTSAALTIALVTPAAADLTDAAALERDCRAAVERRTDYTADLTSVLIQIGVHYGRCMGYIEGAVTALAALTRDDGGPYFCLPEDLQQIDVARAIVAEFDADPEIVSTWAPRLAVFMALAPYACGATQ